jgi:enoyl-CoA hydratase
MTVNETVAHAVAEEYRGYRSLSMTRRGRVLTITLNTLDKKNAVDDDLHAELSRVFYDVEADPLTDVAILTGVDRWFCAGGDMNWFQAMIDDPRHWDAMIVEARRIINGLLELRKPIIARVNGAAAGLGASIALLCDIIVAEESARIGDPHVAMGLVAGDGGAVIWPQLIGFARAKEMLLTGRMLTAREALDMGLVNYVTSASDLDAKVDELAFGLARGATQAIRWTKAVVNLELRRISNLMTEAALGWETLSNATYDHQEAVHAFVAKRTPVFRGR